MRAADVSCGVHRTSFGRAGVCVLVPHASLCIRVCVCAGCSGQVDGGQQGPWCGSCTSKLDGKFSDLFCESRVAPSPLPPSLAPLPSNGATPLRSRRCACPLTHPTPVSLSVCFSLFLDFAKTKTVGPAVESTWKSAKTPLAECQSSDSGLSARADAKPIGESSGRVASSLCCYFFATCRFDRRLVTPPAKPTTQLVICFSARCLSRHRLVTCPPLSLFFSPFPLVVLFFVRHRTKYRAFFHTASLRPLTFITLPSTYHNSPRPARKNIRGSRVTDRAILYLKTYYKKVT